MRSEPEGCSGAGHHGLAAMGGHDGRDLRGVGCDRDPAYPGGLGTAHHVHDHRLPRDIGERLAGQAGGGHAGRNKHQDAGIDHWFKGLGSRAWKRGVFRAGKWGGDGREARSLIRVARPRANRYLNGKTRGNNKER